MKRSRWVVDFSTPATPMTRADKVLLVFVALLLLALHVGSWIPVQGG